jgi:hypothetical protein
MVKKPKNRGKAVCIKICMMSQTGLTHERGSDRIMDRVGFEPAASAFRKLEMGVHGSIFLIDV